ncbi:MAG: sulfatase-like hydrolase/transferase, partial [Planctomycetota bacterium]
MTFRTGLSSWGRVFGAALAVLSCGLGGVVAEAARPNIVVFMADDWSWPDAAALGAPGVKTPSFDRVAREGVLFPNAFVSTPSCTPSRLSILTGQHHWRLREGDSLGGSLRLEYDVYTDILAEAGY